MKDSSDFPHKGQCLCGSIQYEVAEIDSRIGHCHCSMCRKFHGAAFATFASANADDFRWVAGKEVLKTYRAENATLRKFCANCGSSLIFEAEGDERGLVIFALGTLDTAIDLRPVAHLFTDHGASWYEITDDLLQFKENA
ncbi:MAG: GFA family protein [Thiolinea sp.]